MSHPWYAFYPKDYRDKTGGLTMVQDGAYRRLMDHYYITGEPLEANASVLFRVCCAFDEVEQAAVLFVLEKFFLQGDDGWHHLRIDEEIIKRAELTAKRVTAGKLGGNSKNKPKTASARANAKQVPRQLPPHTHTQDISSLRSDNTRPPKPVAPASKPAWLDAAAWAGYAEMRRRIRAPMTARAETLAIAELERLTNQGHDPTAILDQSTQNSWKGLFPIKPESNSNGRQNGKPSANDKFLSAAHSLVTEYLGGPEGGDDSGFADETSRPLLPPRLLGRAS